jgi:hypothetical protein
MFHDKFEKYLKDNNHIYYTGFTSYMPKFEWLKFARQFIKCNINLFKEYDKDNDGFDIKCLDTNLRYGSNQAKQINELIDQLLIEGKDYDEIIVKLSDELRLTQDTFRSRYEVWIHQIPYYEYILNTTIDNFLALIYANEFCKMNSE